ncbi:MAG: DNA helicase PcrA [Candidatus Geothermincolia bacterium]
MEQLNPAQKDAVTHTEGPLLILAGAGSGKTRVLTHRIAYLIGEKGVSPASILAVTFTNKAAGEMRHRIGGLVGPAAEHMWVGTFHATCARMLRMNAERVGRTRNFIVYDEDDRLRLIKQVMRELDMDPQHYPPKSIQYVISAAKNAVQGPDAVLQLAESALDEAASSVYRRYQKALDSHDALDFDDLIMKAILMLEEHDEVLEHYQERFRYVNIDEYQDTNHAQYRLVNLLARRYRNLCVVGDDDQSIYSWRGADIRNILDFEQDYPDARVIKLEQNYRSTQVILEVANEVIAHNEGRKAKTLWTARGEGEPVVRYRAASGQDEALFVAREIERLTQREDCSLRDMAIFYRINAQSRSFEEVFLKLGIPYKVVGGAKFYERREVKDMLAYLRAVNNAQDAISLRRIINVPKRAIGDTSVAHVEDFARLEGLTFWEGLERADEVPNLNGPAAKRIKQFVEMIVELREGAAEGRLSDLVERIWSRSGYMRELREQRTLEAEGRIENIEELQNVMLEFERGRPGEGLGEFLEQVALITDIDLIDDDEGAVTLMTIHNAKGLEYPVVFMVGMEDGIFPHIRSVSERDGMEEERRLCYVGITRARSRLYLTNALYRILHGGSRAHPESRFLRDIPSRYVTDMSPRTAGAPPQPARASEARLQYLAGEFRVGDRVEHAKWGEGTVLAVSMSSSGPEVAVFFEHEGEKLLLLEYAPLKKLS